MITITVRLKECRDEYRQQQNTNKKQKGAKSKSTSDKTCSKSSYTAVTNYGDSETQNSSALS